MTDTVIERKEVPGWITRRVNRLGGMNQFGRPNFRVVWGGNRTHKVGGKFKKVIYIATGIIGEAPKALVTEVAEIRELLKYHPFRWHLERWRGAEHYGSREEWYELTYDAECGFHTQGDYPSEGDYEHVFYLGMCSHMRPGDRDWCVVCQAGCGEYISLEENFNLIELQIKALQMSDDVNPMQERLSLFLREDQKRRLREKIVDDRVRDAMRPKFAVEQPSTLMDGVTRCNVPDARFNTAFMPNSRSSFSQSTKTMPAKKQEDLESN